MMVMVIGFSMGLLVLVSVAQAGVAHHRICCSAKSSHNTIKADTSGLLLTKWTEYLLPLIEPKSNEDDGPACLHEFGVSTVDQLEWSEKGYSLRHGDKDRSTYEHQFVTKTLKSERVDKQRAQCASISLAVNPTSEPVKSSVDFFMPQLLDEMTRQNPKVRIERGTAEFEDLYGHVRIQKYTPTETKFFDYEDAYLFGSHSSSASSRLATEKELRNVVHRGVCSSPQCETIFPFLEAVTGTRIPEEFELVRILTKEEIKHFLSFEELRSIDFVGMMAKLKSEVEKSGKEFVKRRIPMGALRRLRPVKVSRALSKATVGQLLSKARSVSSRQGGSLKHVAARWGIGNKADRVEIVNLSYYDEDTFAHFVKKAQKRALGKWTRMRDVLTSTQIADAFPQEQRRRSQNSSRTRIQKSKSRKGDRELSPRQITDFLLVNSLLAVSNTKYSDVIASGMIHRLDRSDLPLFIVCGESIDWTPKQYPPTTTGSSSPSGADWLSANYRFRVNGFRLSRFQYRSLSERHTKEREMSECAILALIGVPEIGFEQLTRQSFDMLFGVFTRERSTIDHMHYVPREYSDGRPTVSFALGVDPWELLPEGGSSLILFDLFDQVADSIKEKGSFEWPEERLI